MDEGEIAGQDNKVGEVSDWGHNGAHHAVNESNDDVYCTVIAAITARPVHRLRSSQLHHTLFLTVHATVHRFLFQLFSSLCNFLFLPSCLCFSLSVFLEISHLHLFPSVLFIISNSSFSSRFISSSSSAVHFRSICNMNTHNFPLHKQYLTTGRYVTCSARTNDRNYH